MDSDYDDWHNGRSRCPRVLLVVLTPQSNELLPGYCKTKTPERHLPSSIDLPSLSLMHSVGFAKIQVPL